MIIDHDPCLALFALPKSNFGFNSIEGYCWIIMYTLLYAKIGIGLCSFIIFFHQWTQLCLQGKFSECLLWPGIAGGEGCVVVVVVQLRPDELLDVFRFGVG